MTITEQADKFEPCICGNVMTEYYIGYGRTPYIFSCTCGKNQTLAKCKITGGTNNLFDYWNKHFRHLTLSEVKNESNEVHLFLQNESDEHGETPCEYQYYWQEIGGEYLVQKW